MNADEMPRLSKENLQIPERHVRDLRPGERGVLLKSISVRVDEDFRVWINSEVTLMEGEPLPRLSVQVERTETGFILWLNKEDRFTPEKLARGKSWIPVVELRRAEEDG